MRILVLFILLCLVSSAALSAGFGKPRISTPGVQYISDPEKPVRWVTYEFQKKYGVQKLFDVKPFYPMVPVTAERLLTRPKIDVLAKNLAKRIGPVGLLVSAIDLMWDPSDNTWKKPEEVKDYPEGCWVYGSNACRDSPSEVCQNDVSYSNTLYKYSHFQLGSTGKTVTCRCCRSDTGACVNCGSATLKEECPAGYVRKDGECVLRSYRPATDAEIQDKVSEKIDENGPGSFLQPLLNNGLEPQMIDDADPISSVDGPTGAQKPTVEVKTKTDSTGTTTITTTTTPYISYQGDTVIIEIHIHRRYVFPDGSTKDEDETDKKDDPDEKDPPDLCQKYPNSAMCKPPVDLCEKYPNIALCQPPPEGQEQKDFCEEHPEASACKPLDDVPDVDLPEDEKDFDIDPEMSATGECPAPIQVVILGSNYSITWEPVCYVARGIRPFVIISGWLGAGIFLFMIGAVSRGR